MEAIVTTNLAGLKIGHATNEEFHTGCTVLLCPEGTVAGADVRGPAPGSREMALLGLDKPIEHIHAVLLTGGSAFGLAAADGVMRYLAERGIGHPTPIKPVPLVPAAVVYDLILGMGQFFPDADMGYAACLAASDEDVPQGNVGAGSGVTVGKWAGFSGIMKSGFGLAVNQIGDLVVGTAVVVNAVGDVVNEDGSVLAGAHDGQGGWLVAQDPYRRFPQAPPAQLGTNTTLAAVFTNAKLSKVEANRLAQRAHDGLAIAIRPVHTTHDGDTAFALATGRVAADFDALANIAVITVEQAIRSSVRHAQTVGPFLGLGAG
jgi:L-aminopeptidase/D-esterase-like protein